MTSTNQAMRAVALTATLWGLTAIASQPLNAQCPLYLDPATTRLQASDLTDQSIINMKFAARQLATTQSNVCSTPLLTTNSCGKPDVGEGFAAKVFGRLASAKAADRAEAITALTNLKRSDLADFMGSTVYESGCSVSDFFLSPLLGTLLNNVNRPGEADVSMLVLMTAVYYGIDHNLFSASDDVVTNVLSLIDLNPGPGSVETLSFGFNTPVVCGLVCAATGFVDPVCLGCLAVIPQENVLSPETENHLNNIYTSQYLANQLLHKRTGNPQYENARNGYKSLLVTRLKNFVHHDFIEYNARPYQDYTMFSLLTLSSYAEDSDVQAAAKMVLDYLSAKVAVSSSDLRRSTPFRRKNDSQYFCSDLLNPSCADPQTAFYMMLTGVTDILPKNNQADSYSVEFAWAGTTDYRVDHSILDLFVNRSHRNFYQFFHYTNTGTNDELYFGSPSYLISAGGHPNKNAYAKDLPFPVSLIASVSDVLSVLGIKSTPFVDGQLVDPSGDDLGVAVPTTLMPTGDGITSRDQLIQFYDSTNENLCVWRNFACGLNPVVPSNYAVTPPGSTSKPPPGTGNWTFYDESGGSVGQKAGFYAAVYQQDGFGFLEVYDTWSNPQMLTSLNAFANAVFENNAGATFSKTNPNNYKTVAGSVIQFLADAKIVTVDGKPPYDPTRTNGDIIDDNGQGLVTIKNPALGTSLTLDATIPPSQPQITVPGPLTFADTCVGATSTATLNVCNDGTGSDDLFVYNILSQNKQFHVTEPSSGYPTTVGTSFCFPFQAQFTPAMAGAISSNLTISSSDPAVPYLNVKVNGNGIQQGIATVIASGGNFGNVCIGSFADLNLTINNTGGCDLKVTGIASDSGEFTVPSTLSYPLVIHAGGSLVVPIRFQPSSLGLNKTGTITVNSNDPNHATQSIAVSGNVPAPMINASIANNGNFGNVCAGTQSDLTLQVINQGLCPLTISSIATPAGTSFALPSATTFPVVLAASGSINLPIRFQPAAFGTPGYMTCNSTTPQASMVTIKSDDPKYTGGFPIGVNGIEGCPKLILSPQNLTGAFAFPPTVSDPSGSLGCYTDRQITIGNSGICPLYVTSLTAGPSNTFNVTNPSVPLTIAPGAAPVPATIRFRPTSLTGQLSNAPDQQTGTLTISSNDPLAGGNAAGLCGEPVYHSGIRALVVNATGQPINPLKSLSLASKGLKPNISQTLSPAIPATAPNICGNSITYTLDNETLPPAGTTGNNPNASYTLSAKQGSTSATMSFTLGQCEFKQPILQIR